MSSTDDWLQNGLPNFSGGKDRTVARKMIDHLGGPTGFKTSIRTNADGSVTTVQLKGAAPPQITTILSKQRSYYFRYSYSLNTTSSVQNEAAQTSVLWSALTPYMAHDSVVCPWWSEGIAAVFTKANRVLYGSGGVNLWLPDGEPKFVTFPAFSVGGVVYIGNRFHGLVSKTGALLQVSNTTVSSTASGLDVVSPDTYLVKKNPTLLNLTVTGGALTNYAILSTYDRIYDYDTGVKWGVNRSVYDAPTGSRFLIFAASAPVSAAFNEAASVMITIFATLSTPNDQASTAVTIGEFLCASPAAGIDTNRAHCLPFFQASPSGNKLCVTVTRCKKLSDDFRWAHYISSVYEIVFQGGSSTTPPSCSLNFVDSTANDVSTTTYGTYTARKSSLLKYDGMTEVITKETIYGMYNEFYDREVTRTMNYSLSKNPTADIPVVTASHRTQIAIVGYTDSIDMYEELKVIRVEVKADYTYTGYSDTSATTGTYTYVDHGYWNTDYQYAYGFYSRTSVSRSGINGTYHFGPNGGAETDPMTYPRDEHAELKINILVNGVVASSRAYSADSLAGSVTYTATTPVSEIDLENYMLTSSTTVPASSTGDTAEALPDVYGSPWANQVVAFSSNNTVIFEALAGAATTRVLITLEGLEGYDYGTPDADGLYWVTYNPVTKLTSSARQKVWI